MRPCSAAAPRRQAMNLPALESEPEGEDGRGQEEDEGPWQRVPEDVGDLLRVAAEADAHVAAEEVRDVGEVLLPAAARRGRAAPEARGVSPSGSSGFADQRVADVAWHRLEQEPDRLRKMTKRIAICTRRPARNLNIGASLLPSDPTRTSGSVRDGEDVEGGGGRVTGPLHVRRGRPTAPRSPSSGRP